MVDPISLAIDIFPFNEKGNESAKDGSVLSKQSVSDSALANQVLFYSLDFFRASELVDAGTVICLAKKIERERWWTTPISVEKESGIIMDGNHRLKVAMMLGLKYLPCIAISYSDPRVKVLDWVTGEPYDIQKIYRTIDENRLLPYKTTRHIFDPSIPNCKVPLSILS
jgi:hypothetical protein